MEPIKVHKLNPDPSAIVGFALVAHGSITEAGPASVGDGEASLEVPMRFYQGNLNLVRAEIHKLVDDAIDALADA